MHALSSPAGPGGSSPMWTPIGTGGSPLPSWDGSWASPRNSCGPVCSRCTASPCTSVSVPIRCGWPPGSWRRQTAPCWISPGSSATGTAANLPPPSERCWVPALGSTARKIPHHFGVKIPQIGAETRRRIKYNQVRQQGRGRTPSPGRQRERSHRAFSFLPAS